MGCLHSSSTRKSDGVTWSSCCQEATERGEPSTQAAHFLEHNVLIQHSADPHTRKGARSLFNQVLWSGSAGTQPSTRSQHSIGSNMRVSAAQTTRPQAQATVQASPKAPVSLSQVLATKPNLKAVLLDQFGVLHDGQQPYPQAVRAVQELAQSGTKVFIVSNSSRRSSGTIGKLAKMGFKEDWFAGAVTSGELAHQYLQNRPTDWWKTLGRRVLHLNWSHRGPVSLEGLNLDVVDWPEEAEFILAHGTEAVGSAWGRPVRDMSLDQIKQLLFRCAATSQVMRRPLPMIVANPDLVTVDGQELITMPGTLARVYEELGGSVQLMGKPAPLIYEACLESLGMQGQQDQVLAIGDSIEHDIAGASAAGIESLFIAGGIHAQELQVKPVEHAGGDGPQEAYSREALDKLCAIHSVQPQYVSTFLHW